ncbi:MAG: 3-keto-5-aminohexanoate cleavage protein, partial [Solirubrobacteraceae bacterium]
DVRVGLEDTLVLPDGATAASNAELVTSAVASLTHSG